MIPIKMPGQRLSKSARRLIEAQKYAHLSLEQEDHLENLKATVEQAQVDFDAAMERYTRATARRLEDGSNERMARANHARMECADRLQSAKVALAAAEKAWGLKS